MSFFLLASKKLLTFSRFLVKIQFVPQLIAPISFLNKFFSFQPWHRKKDPSLNRRDPFYSPTCDDTRRATVAERTVSFVLFKSFFANFMVDARSILEESLIVRFLKLLSYFFKFSQIKFFVIIIYSLN